MAKEIKQTGNKVFKFFLIILGSISLGLGVLGIFLPLLPTTPFLLLSAALFLRSSRRLYHWLMNHKYLGKHLQNYIQHKTIPRKTKIYAISLLWTTILLTAFFAVPHSWVKILLIIIASAVTFHILSFKSNRTI
ncbi:MAG TPA: YbaN family protein [Bacteroidales bacterium]|nr:YbaN family protein [Bacteroidales bacterium]